MMRTLCHALLFFVLLLSFGSTFATPCEEKWPRFKATYISEDGRVIDYQNAQITHSEGQGFALIAALICDDKEMFDRILTWSENNLGTGLKAWKWGFNGENWTILDKNNATDGDILHAWALLKAGEKWQNSLYTNKGSEIIDALKACCIREDGIILPGESGFIKPEGLVINLSYYIFPAFNDFVRLDTANAELWKQTTQTGLKLIKQSRDKQTGLPPDWLMIKNDNTLMPYPGGRYVFGYEAIRIPLYLSAAGKTAQLSIFRKLLSTIKSDGRMAACTSAESAPECTEDAGYGFYGVMSRVARDLKLSKEKRIISAIYMAKNNNERRYYDAILSLLSHIM